MSKSTNSDRILAASLALFALIALNAATCCWAQDYDDEGYGNSAANQGEGDNYPNNDDNYANNNYQPNYQQNVDSDSSNNAPSSGYYSPQSQGSGADSDADYEGDDTSAAASAPAPTVMRPKRSVESAATEPSAKLHRVKRHGKYYIGPVYTYVKTDKHANFKWGVKHKVGKKHYG